MKKALVLCATIPHTMLLEKLRARGFYTIVADMNPQAPAVPYADEFVEESAFDKDKMLQVASGKDVDLVISSCSEQANSVACYVAEELGLPHPYSYETSLDVTDKGRMKTIFKQGNVTTSNFMVYHDIKELENCELKYPLVVKPVDAYSSKGVRRVENRTQLFEFGQYALNLSRAGRGIVEEYCPGMELQIDCVAIDGKAHVLMTRSKRTMSQESFELNSSGSVVPAAIQQDEFVQAEDLAQNIVNAFGLENTPFFYQARLNNGIISVLEFAPRIGGGLSFQMVKRATGVDIVDLSIESFLGRKLSLAGKYDKMRNIGTILLYMEPGIFGSVRGLDELLKDGIVDYASVLKKKGNVVDLNRTSSNRAVTLLLSGDTRVTVEEKIKETINRIDILDIEGNSRMAR